MTLSRENNTWLFVFTDEDHAAKWEWLFVDILRMKYTCANGYFNAFSR